MNTRALRKVADRIISKPKFFQMPTLGKALQNAKGEYCGAACCIAGEAVIMAGAKTSAIDDFGDIEIAFIPNKRLTNRLKGLGAIIHYGHRMDAWLGGQAVLGLDREQANRLFLANCWPEQFLKAYKNAKTDRGRARAGYRRIHHFIKTQGEE